jgi:AraC-type DNA-binding domain-containing proteins
MQQFDTIKLSLAYIEKNLKTDIQVQELAQLSGYSVWHYQRLFAQFTGFSVAAYTAKRRLNCVLSDIINRRKAVDVVLEYGFDTYAGFYKAFRRMYGCSPRKYLSIYGQQEFNKEILIMFTETELRKVLKNWNIPQSLPIHDVYIMDGTKVSNNVWEIGDDYILKTEDHAMLLRNINISKALSAQGFITALPFQTKAGKDFTEGEHIFVLSNKLLGGPLSKSKRFGAERRDFGIKYGENIARLHNALKVIESDIQPYDQDLFSHVVDWALPETQKQHIQWQMKLPDDFFKNYMTDFAPLSEKLPKQLIHRDPNPSNILFSKDNVSGFLDFDISERNARLWDPCYCATGILSECHNVENANEKWMDILSGILHGYDNINPLTTDEKQSIYHVICSIQMIFAAYCEPQSELKELAKTNREMLEFIVGCKKQIDNIF